MIFLVGLFALVLLLKQSQVPGITMKHTCFALVSVTPNGLKQLLFLLLTAKNP